MQKIIMTLKVRKEVKFMSDCSKTSDCIKCSVKNCVYHSTENRCNAESIEVGNSTAHTCSETCCDTFKSKE